MDRFTLQELAEKTQAQLIGDPSIGVAGVSDLDSAGPADISFFSNPLYRPLRLQTKAAAICIHKDEPLISGKNFLLSESPSATFQRIAELFLGDQFTTGFSGIHPTAVIHPTAILGKSLQIGPHVVIDQGCVIGDRTRIGAGTVFCSAVEVGADCLIHPNVTIREGCKLGNRVILQPGVVLGSCGYGYITDAKGIHTKLDQYGIVIIEDDVEIGANTTIDRARFHETRIGKGTKIDNLVQIAHNVQLGPHNLIVSQTGISGSVTTGRNVVMGGQTGTVGHLKIADGALFAARSGIKKSIAKGGKYGGNPAIPLDQHHREEVTLRKLVRKK